MLYRVYNLNDELIYEEELQETEEDFLFRTENDIQMLKNNLSETDYKAIKYAEGLLTEDEYEEVFSQRQQWRNKINELEAIIKKKQQESIQGVDENV